MGNWDAKKYLDGQMKGKVAGQNILGLPKQILMAIQFMFSCFMPCHVSTGILDFIKHMYRASGSQSENIQNFLPVLKDL